jgi:hypothetical protein
MTKYLKTYWRFFLNLESQQDNLQSLKSILFADKTTAESINLFLELKRDFEEELSKRKVEAIQENNSVNNYFRSRASLPYTTVKDAVFNEPIQN